MASRQELVDYAVRAASESSISPEIFVRQIEQESGFRPDAKSPAGALGIAQFMPATAEAAGIDPWDPWASLDAAARLMRSHIDRFGGDYSLALAAYNAGAGAVEKYGGVPPYEETEHYVALVLGPDALPAGRTGQENSRSGASRLLAVAAAVVVVTAIADWIGG